MQDKKIELSVSTDVIEKMAELAACEVEGVIGLSKKSIDLKDAVRNRNAFKGVKVESVNGAVEVSLYICVDRFAKVREVAEAVQKSVKEKIQNMINTAVTKVNVTVADIRLEEDTAEKA